MRVGGERIVKMYQCGLRSQGLYFGAVDGVYSAIVRQAHARRARVIANAIRSRPIPSAARGLLKRFTTVLISPTANRCTASEISLFRTLDASGSRTWCGADELWTALSRLEKSNKVQV